MHYSLLKNPIVFANGRPLRTAYTFHYFQEILFSKKFFVELKKLHAPRAIGS